MPKLKKDDVPKATYNRFSETILSHTSRKLQCPAFCKGKNCKYDSSDCWPRDQMAIDGIYSHWVTEKILAMARPNEKGIEKYRMLEQFKSHGINTIINLQDPGEHSSCGPGLTKSGFTYDPQKLMQNGVYYYNFSWRDYGVVPFLRLLDMVKVLAFAVTQGKVGIHCHAGLGRTGVLIACYLVYTFRCKPTDAVIYVRIKRPKAIQTSGQLKCVQKFFKNLEPSFAIFSNTDYLIKDFSIHEHLKRQKRILHGYEARHLKHIPKVFPNYFDLKREVKSPVEPSIIASALLDDYLIRDDEFRKALRQYQKDFNSNGNIWAQLWCEEDPKMLAAILWSWLDHLGEPVLATRDLSKIVMRAKQPIETLSKLDRGTRYTTEYVLRFIARLKPLSSKTKQSLLRRTVASLTKQGIPINGILKPVGVSWNKMREGTLKKVIQFINGVFLAVANENIVSDDSDED